MNYAIMQPAVRTKVAWRLAILYARRLAIDARLVSIRARQLYVKLARFLIQLPQPLGSLFLKVL